MPGVTVFHAVDDAIEAIGHAVRYAEWRRMPRAEEEPHDADRAEAARAVAREFVMHHDTGSGWAGADDVKMLLEPYGLMPVGTLAENLRDASEAAEKLGFPVAVKVADQNIVHKTDRGLVRVGLRSTAEVAAALQAFGVELGRDDVPVLVQPVVEGVEVALGVGRDPGFGPLVMVAAGGIATGILEDRAFLLPPFSRRDAARAIRSLRIWPLMDGYRGAEPVDTESLEQLLVALGELAVDTRAGRARLQPGDVHADRDGARRRQGPTSGGCSARRGRSPAAPSPHVNTGQAEWALITCLMRV